MGKLTPHHFKIQNLIGRQILASAKYDNAPWIDNPDRRIVRQKIWIRIVQLTFKRLSSLLKIQDIFLYLHYRFR